MKKRYLVLSNGKYFEGYAIGAEGNSIGELVFTTGMEGYLETLTDPSYAGQIVVQTFPMIGNYGVIPQDFEGEPALKGYVVSEICSRPSNFRSECDLNTYLVNNGIVGIAGVDTREITKIIRENGVTNAGIFDELPADLTAVREYAIVNAVQSVTCPEIELHPAIGEKKYSVGMLNYGLKRNILRSLTSRGCEVTVYPASTPAEQILAGGHDGLMLSNGPGDPAENIYCIQQIAKLVGRIPIFGICLGHQLTAIAMGGKTIKLKYGHRGGNQPVKSLENGRTYITSQNHGYAVVADSLAEVANEIFVNANDGSSEGMLYKGKRCFTVQFHPEASSGPHDTGFLFDRFLRLMDGENYEG